MADDATTASAFSMTDQFLYNLGANRAKRQEQTEVFNFDERSDASEEIFFEDSQEHTQDDLQPHNDNNWPHQEDDNVYGEGEVDNVEQEAQPLYVEAIHQTHQTNNEDDDDATLYEDSLGDENAEGAQDNESDQIKEEPVTEKEVEEVEVKKRRKTKKKKNKTVKKKKAVTDNGVFSKALSNARQEKEEVPILEDKRDDYDVGDAMYITKRQALQDLNELEKELGKQPSTLTTENNLETIQIELSRLSQQAESERRVKFMSDVLKIVVTGLTFVITKLRLCDMSNFKFNSEKHRSSMVAISRRASSRYSATPVQSICFGVLGDLVMHVMGQTAMKMMSSGTGSGTGGVSTKKKKHKSTPSDSSSSSSITSNLISERSVKSSLISEPGHDDTSVYSELTN